MAVYQQLFDVRLATGMSSEIVSLVVDETTRGNSVGTGLVTIAEVWLKGRVGIIRIRANTRREKVHTFYNNLGYSFAKTQAIFSKNI